MNPDEHVEHIRNRAAAHLAERQAAADAAAAEAAQQAPVDPAEVARQAQAREETWARARSALLGRSKSPLPANQQRQRAEDVRAFVEGENDRLREGRVLVVAPATPAAPAAPSAPPAAPPATAPVRSTMQLPARQGLPPAAFPSAPNTAGGARLANLSTSPGTVTESVHNVTTPDAVRRGDYAKHRDQLHAQFLGKPPHQVAAGPGHGSHTQTAIVAGVQQQQPLGEVQPNGRAKSGLPPLDLKKHLAERAERRKGK